MLCEVVVRDVGRDAQDVVAVPGEQDPGPLAGLSPEWVRGEADQGEADQGEAEADGGAWRGMAAVRSLRGPPVRG